MITIPKKNRHFHPSIASPQDKLLKSIREPKVVVTSLYGRDTPKMYISFKGSAGTLPREVH
jgi:hypothetical protein